MVCGKILENFKRWKGSDQAAEWILGHTDCDIHILVCVDYSVEQSERQRKLSRLQCPCYDLVALMCND